MRLSRANIPLASEDRTHSQAISPSPHYNLAPHYRPGFINLQHFCHSRWRNPVRLSKSGFSVPVIASQKGGQHGGGASLTEFGHAVVQHYRAIESAAEKAGAAHIEALSAALARRTRPASKITGAKTRRLARSVG